MKTKPDIQRYRNMSRTRLKFEERELLDVLRAFFAGRCTAARQDPITKRFAKTDRELIREKIAQLRILRAAEVGDKSDALDFRAALTWLDARKDVGNGL